MQQNAASAAQSLAQRRWEEYMSNTSWQRGVRDMRAAGVNPMLSFMEGGASTPGGAAAQAPANPIGDAVSTAMQTMQLRKQLRILEANATEAEAKADTAESEWAFRFGDPRQSAGTRADQEFTQGLATAKALQRYNEAGVPQREGSIPSLTHDAINAARELWRKVSGGRTGRQLVYPTRR